ncbi:MAG: hypothetical protein FWD61_06500 [Phycisphaerales bacterium]|nr:hypothetical protein [Phycisphaerales bacterium]
MTPCFADTFFFLALLNANDCLYHDQARQANRVDRPILVSSWIFLELGDHLCDEKNRPLFEQVLEAVRGDHRFEIAPADQSVLDAAIELYNNRPDKSWSLTDCTSFILMRLRGITEALTADRYFEQAGFTALLK